VARNFTIEPNLEFGLTEEVAVEEVEAGVELLKRNDLSFNFADLFRDNPLGHLLEDKEALLNNIDGFSAADYFFALLDDSLTGDRAHEVIGTVEVVKSRERFQAFKAIKRRDTPRGEASNGRDGRRGSASDEGSGQNELVECREHFDQEKWIQKAKRMNE
jgi:hypothetical protein